MKITRDVVSDLWPLYSSGEASADTRVLVDEFLRDDPEFARAGSRARRSCPRRSSPSRPRRKPARSSGCATS